MKQVRVEKSGLVSFEQKTLPNFLNVYKLVINWKDYRKWTKGRAITSFLGSAKLFKTRKPSNGSKITAKRKNL